jgi:hypothetical protein
LLIRDVGDPSERLESAPTAKRDEPFKSTEALGGVGIGEEPPLPSYVAIGMDVVGYAGGDLPMAGFVGVPARCSGVFWNSARVPFSVSSLQRTPRLVFDGVFFFIGEN